MIKNRKKFLQTALMAILLGLGTGSLLFAADGGGVVGGYRGATLPVQPHQLLNIQPGDRVDVMVTFEAKLKDDEIEKVTATILQNVLVLDARPKEGLVQLMLNPNEAQYAVLAVEEGKVWIVLRGSGDRDMKPMEMASFRKLFR